MRLSAILRTAGFRVCAALLISASGAWAVPVYSGVMTGGSAFGVADYGAPAQANPTFIQNNVYGTNDVLVSPGGGFLTADTAIHNNIASFGPIAGPYWSAWTGGNGPSGGVFGSGGSMVTPTSVGFRLTDVNPNGSGFAAYHIVSWQTTWLNADPWAGVIGNWLGVTGTFAGAQSAGAVSLVTTVSATSGYFQRLELVLGAANIGNYNNVAEGDFFALQNPGGAFSTWSGLAYNRRNAAFGVNDVITVTTTLTAIADPMSMEVFDSAPLDLLTEAGGPGIPTDWDVVTMTTATPEPGSMLLLGAGLAGLAFFGRRLSAN